MIVLSLKVLINRLPRFTKTLKITMLLTSIGEIMSQVELFNS